MTTPPIETTNINIMIVAGGARNEQGRRVWHRLKPASVDYLDSIGFPSKGDERLLDFPTQEKYFAKVRERYNGILSSSAVHSDDLDDAFASLSLEAKSTKSAEIEKPNAKNVGNIGSPPYELTSASTELSIVLMAMRKIREAIVASARRDAFALGAYTFIIRATIPLKHMESYYPALLHLLYKLNPIVPLKESEHKEFLGYYILDLACRQGDLAAAYEAKCHSKYQDARIEIVLKALIHGNWYMYWALKEAVTRRQKALMEWADDRIRIHALKCLGKSYLTMDKQQLENSVQRPWEKLEEKDGLGWQLDDDVVIIRKISRK